MIDQFQNHSTSLESPASHLQTVTPHDEENLPFVTRAIAVGGEGFVKVTMRSGSVGRVFVVPGAPFPIRASRIWVNGTTATDIVALA